MKNVVVFLVAVLGFGLVTGFLYHRVPLPVAIGLGFFVMQLIGYRLQMWYRSELMPFSRWVILAAINALVCTAAGFLIVRVLRVL
jgi:hypothetical protein